MPIFIFKKINYIILIHLKNIFLLLTMEQVNLQMKEPNMVQSPDLNNKNPIIDRFHKKNNNGTIRGSRASVAFGKIIIKKNIFKKIIFKKNNNNSLKIRKIKC